MLVVTAVACRSQPSPPPPPEIPTIQPLRALRIGLADSAAPLANLISVPLTQYNDQIRLQFITGNAAALQADLAAGQLDAILVHDLPANSDFWFNPIVMDGLVLVVHFDNPVDTLTLAEAQAIFSGEINNWAQVGGHETPITLVSREIGSGARKIFSQRILGEQRLPGSAQIQPSSTAVLQVVAANPTAIGYGMAGAAAGEKLLSIDGITPVVAELAAQNYPLSAPLYFAARAEPQDDLRSFLGWLQSGMGQAALGERYGRLQ